MLLLIGNNSDIIEFRYHYTAEKFHMDSFVAPHSMFGCWKEAYLSFFGPQTTEHRTKNAGSFFLINEHQLLSWIGEQEGEERVTTRML